MADLALALPGRARRTLSHNDADARRHIRLRVALGLLAVLVCYHTSLFTLVRGLSVDTPLAYLGLVPFVAAALGFALARSRPGEFDIHDRHLDLIVGGSLVTVALLALVVAPPRMSTMYWLWRIDLLTMPLFVAGVVAMLFGVRMLWRTKVAVLFLFAAWPIPFRGLVTRLLEPMAAATATAVGHILHVVPLASPATGDGATFRVPHGSTGFLVTIASACSGANGVLGFTLVAGAIALAMAGSRTRKLAWLGTGLAFVWVLNLARILLIVAVGRLFGENAAINVLHPYVGLVTFNLAVVVMMLVLSRFGLRPMPGVGRRWEAIRTAVPDARHAMAVVLALGAIGGMFNHGLQRYDPIASSLGTSKLLPFRFVGRDVGGFLAEPKVQFDNGRRFFGEDSNWIRYSFNGTGGDGPVYTNVPILADVISTGNLQSFSDFGIEACYRFHGFETGLSHEVQLGHGIRGTLLHWTDADTGVNWVSLYWIWAVRQGSSLRYERVVLLLNEDRNLQIRAPRLSDEQEDALTDSADPARAAKEKLTGRFMAAFATKVVDASVANSGRYLDRTDAN